MTLQLNLPTEMEGRLHLESKRSGLSSEAVALRLLDQHLPPPEDSRRTVALALLEKWAKEDANLSDEDAAANAEVLRTLDNDRPSHRKLFAELGKEEQK